MVTIRKVNYKRKNPLQLSSFATLLRGSKKYFGLSKIS